MKTLTDPARDNRLLKAFTRFIEQRRQAVFSMTIVTAMLICIGILRIIQAAIQLSLSIKHEYGKND